MGEQTIRVRVRVSGRVRGNGRGNGRGDGRGCPGQLPWARRETAKLVTLGVLTWQ